MRMTYISDSDILLVTLEDVAESFGEWHHGVGILSRDREGNLVEVEILNASEGVNMDALPVEVKEEVREYLSEYVLTKSSPPSWVTTEVDSRVPA